ncbi:hypothetical protein [Thermaurantiacus sp.]
MVMLLLSAAGVLLLTGAAFQLGFRASSHLRESRARSEAARLPGFRAIRATLAKDGLGAFVTSASGETAIVLPLGDRFIARAPTLRAARALAFGPPGWKPDDRSTTADSIRAACAASASEQC